MSEIVDSNFESGSEPADGLIYNVRIATMEPLADDDYGVVKGSDKYDESTCIAWRDGKITYIGDLAGAPDIEDQLRINANGQWLTPGLIDCHTHLVYGGNRADEFEALRAGTTYAEISKAGGGINRTVRDTRDASEGDLFESAKVRLNALMREGVTTVEIKSGYGLSVEHELKMLRVIKKLAEELPVSIEATCLAAHTLPFDFKDQANTEQLDLHDAYIDQIISNLLPVVKNEKLATTVDVFCESIAFSAEHTRKLFSAAKALGFNVKGHVEQLTQNSGTDVVCEFSGLSADHLEYTNEAQVIEMSKRNVSAVILPGAFYYLSETQKPPIEFLRKHGVPMAVATDFNPGSSPLASLLVAANMSSVLFSITPAEAFAGITKHAATALGLQTRKGTLGVGMEADMVLWGCHHPRQLVHEINTQRPLSIWHQGRKRYHD